MAKVYHLKSCGILCHAGIGEVVACAKWRELSLAFECPSRSRDHIRHVRIRNITLYSKVSTRTKVEVTD